MAQIQKLTLQKREKPSREDDSSELGLTLSCQNNIASPEKVGWQHAVLKNSDILASINGDFLDMHVTHGISSKYPQTITDAGF